MVSLKDIFGADEQENPMRVLDPLVQLFTTAVAGRSVVQDRLLNPDFDKIEKNLSDTLSDPMEVANVASGFLGPLKLTGGAKVLASYRPADMISKGVKERPVNVLARFLKQKGVDKIPEDWVKGVERYALAELEGMGKGTHWEMPAKHWEAKPFDSFKRGQLPPATPGGLVRMSKELAHKDPAVMTHEIAHEGFQRILPEERARFLYEYLSKKDHFDVLYHGKAGKTPTAQTLAEWPDRGEALWNVYAKANEVFAMAVADKATRSISRAHKIPEWMKYQMKVEKKTPGAYGSLSPKARKIIDKYVKSIAMTLGIPALMGEKEEAKE